jgi:pimeloyl-ACP methyl ester carboxylesterase
VRFRQRLSTGGKCQDVPTELQGQHLLGSAVALLTTSRRWLILAITVAVVIAVAVNTVLVDLQIRAAASRDGGKIFEASGVAANVKVQGDGPTIVLIHGIGGALDVWDDIVPALASQHRVIRMDLIGHGGTAAPRSGYTMEKQAALIAAVLDTLGVDRFTIIGHSMGGEVAIALAAIEPARIERIILLDTPPITFKIWNRLTLLPVLGELLWTVQREMDTGSPTLDKSAADFKQLTYSAFKASYLNSIEYVTTKPAFERLAVLNPISPLLVIVGSRDPLVSPSVAKLYESVQGAKVAMIDGAGHASIVDAPAKTIELITTFLSAPTVAPATR